MAIMTVPVVEEQLDYVVPEPDLDCFQCDCGIRLSFCGVLLPPGKPEYGYDPDEICRDCWRCFEQGGGDGGTVDRGGDRGLDHRDNDKVNYVQ